MTHPRTLRHNADAECSVLGGVILRNDLLVELDRLETNDFYVPAHRVVWEAIRNLEAKQKPIDVVTLEHEIERAGKLEAIGGIALLGELALKVPTAENVVHYAEIVQQLARVRALTMLAGDLLEKSFDADADADELIAMAVAAVGKLDSVRRDDTATVGDIVKHRVRELEKQWADRADGKTVWNGAPTGIANLDRRIGGYPFGDVTILAARPAMGKTAQAAAATEATSEAGFGVHVFASEGGRQMYADRAIARRAGISVEKLRAGELTRDQASAVTLAMMWYSYRPNWKVDVVGGLTAHDIVRRVRKWAPKNKTRLVVVDYLNVLARDPRKSENEALEEIVNVFGQAAPNHDIAWLLLAQLNRKVEERVDKRPVMSDLRGSGALEQVARVVVSPFRGSYYYETPKQDIDYECPPSAGCVGGEKCPHMPNAEQFAALAQILLLKNNNGMTGRVFANWIPETMVLS